jgi:hypothetical protein
MPPLIAGLLMRLVSATPDHKTPPGTDKINPLIEVPESVTPFFDDTSLINDYISFATWQGYGNDPSGTETDPLWATPDSGVFINDPDLKIIVLYVASNAIADVVCPSKVSVNVPPVAPPKNRKNIPSVRILVVLAEIISPPSVARPFAVSVIV